MRFSSHAILSVSGASFTALLPTLCTYDCVVAAVRLDRELNTSASRSLRPHTKIQDNEGHLIEASSLPSDRTVSLQSGAECYIASSTKALEKDTDSDTGILSLCAKDEVCFKDDTSNLGGRCGVLRDEEVARERRLVECVMSDGSAGTKCVGTDACYGIDPDTVGCNSCVGEYACKNAAGPIGEGSCNGGRTCGFAAGSIGKGSCNEIWSCWAITCELTIFIFIIRIQNLS